MFRRIPLTGRVSAVFAGATATPAWTAPATPLRRGPADVADETLRRDLARMIAQDRVVVFLTGTPERPRCGFTVRMVELLRQFGVQYSFVDIMQDDEVCEGLKQYSDWPTYPQLYMDGELVGGYDLTKQMALDGSLVALLKEKRLLDGDVKDE